MTFIVGDKGVVYEKDLGPSSARVAKAMAVFHTDPTWTPVEMVVADSEVSDSPAT
jgi:hypothetical protein